MEHGRINRLILEATQAVYRPNQSTAQLRYICNHIDNYDDLLEFYDDVLAAIKQ